jgi:hypothetical protein
MMIEKEPGNHKIHCLRAIHTCKADYSLLLCVKWCSAVHHATKSKTLNPCQKGGTPDNSAPDVVFIEELEYKICRATRTPLGGNDFNASSCYDRIHCFLANLAGQKYGVDKQICIAQGRSLTEAKYYLRTKFGVLEGFISHCQAYPIYGTGQGLPHLLVIHL